MRKYLYLTSLLALSACFGGGSGGGDSVPASGASVALFDGLISQEGVASNHNITNMTSGIVVATDGSSHAVRSGHVSSGGRDYNVYDLSDVQFKIAENPDMASFQFAIDNGTGRIAKVTETLGGVSDTITRIGDTQRFNGPMFELVKNGSDRALYRLADTGQLMTETLDAAVPTDNEEINSICGSGLANCHWNYIDEILDIGTSARNSDPNADPDIALTFSDFGKFNPVYRSKNKNLTNAMLVALHTQVEIDENTTITVQDYIRQYLSDENNTDTAALTAWLTAKGAGVLVGEDQEYHTYAQQENEFANSQDYQLFAGGYAIKNGALVETLTPTNGNTFSGKAIGRVYTSIQQSNGSDRAALLSKYGFDKAQPIHSVISGEDVYWYNGVQYNDVDALPEGAGTPVDANSVGHDTAAYYETMGATLEVNSGNGDATLTMPFEDFYTVTTTRTVDGNNVTYETTFTDKSDDLEPWFVRENPSAATETEEVGNFGYYGIDTPTEAAGTIAVSDETSISATITDPINPTGPQLNTTGTREWEFQGAYGMTKDN